MDSTKVGNYSKKELIGKGTFGKIFKAQRDGSEKLVALKVVDLTKTGKKDNEHVQNEVKTLQECQHKNLVQFIEWFSIDNYIYIVMGLCNGGNLREHIQEKKGLDEESCIHILEQICNGLKYLHDQTIAHRDVKTTNILLQKQNGELLIKIGDFGLAKVMETLGPAALTICVGSPYFMSPEMIAGQAYDISTDIWSLGCCAYEMATTDVPYEAKEMDRLKDRIKTDRVEYTKIPYSQDIQGLIMAMMEKDKTRRPSAAQIITFLHQHNHTEKVKDNKEQRKTDKFAKTWSPGTKIQPTSTADSLVNRYDTSGYGTTEENEEEVYITEIVPVPVKMDSSKVGKYSKKEQIGKGTFGKIFKAQKDGSEKLVALKVVNLTKSSKKDKEHVQTEVEMLQKCQHKNLVQFIEWFSEDNYIYIVMELCNGGNLREHIQEKKGLDEESCIHILEQICDGLKYLHDKNIAHRDMKTTNILLQKQNVKPLVKIGDFGLAKVMETLGPAAMTTCVGSPYFMSPEMIAGEAYDISTDIWGLGCCTYEMATTDVPYEAKEMDRLKDRIKTDRVEYTKIPYCQDMQDRIMEMLEKDKTRRPSAAQIITFLHQHNHTEKVKENKERRKTDKFAKTWSPGTKMQPIATADTLVNRYDTSGYDTTKENEEEGYTTEIVQVQVRMTEDEKDCLDKAQKLQKDILKRLGGSSGVLGKINNSIERTKHMDNNAVFMTEMEELLDKGRFKRCKCDLGALWMYRSELMKKGFKIDWS